MPADAFFSARFMSYTLACADADVSAIFDARYFDV